VPVVLLKSASKPLAVLSLPVVLPRSARVPVAVLLLPVVLLESAEVPLAVLPLPVVLLKSTEVPLAVFAKPVVLLTSARSPIAVLSEPVLFTSASSPRTVLLFVKQPCWQTARACGASANHATMKAVRKKPFRRGDRLIEFLMREVFICIKQPFCSPDWSILRLHV